MIKKKLEIYSAEWVEEATKDYSEFLYEPCSSCKLRDYFSENNEYICLVSDGSDLPNCPYYMKHSCSNENPNMSIVNSEKEVGLC
jgi:hypothetical protein